MNRKHKEAFVPSQHDSRRALSPGHPQSQLRSARATQPQAPKRHRQLTGVPGLRRPHLPSQGSSQMAENKHYNYPKPECLFPAESRTISPFTFTQLLQQQPQNQPNTGSVSSLLLLPPPEDSFPDNYSQPQHHPFRKRPPSGLPFAPTNSSSQHLSVQGNSRQMEHSSLAAQKREELRSQQERSPQRSVDKSMGRSPVRLANPHRLNNTPKLRGKDRKLPRESASRESKTFASVLHPSAGGRQGHSKGESINLLCSEKMFKFMEQEQELGQGLGLREELRQELGLGEKLESKQLELGTGSNRQVPLKRKSNLLSTGIINLSHPLESSETSLCRPFRQLSKGSQSKLPLDRTASAGEVPGFEDAEPESGVMDGRETLWSTIKELQGRVTEVKQYLLREMKGRQAGPFSDEIAARYSPELRAADISETVSALAEIARQIQASLQTVIYRLQWTARSVAEQIRQSIRRVEDSKQSSVDWASIEKRLEEGDRLQFHFFRSEMIAARLMDLQTKEVTDCVEVSEVTALKHELQRLTEQLTDLESEQLPQEASTQALGQQIIAHFEARASRIRKAVDSLEEVLFF